MVEISGSGQVLLRPSQHTRDTWKDSNGSVAVKIDPAVRERMKRLTTRRQCNEYLLMREAIHPHVKREEGRDAFLRQARHAWQEYRETGLHASAAQVLVWLGTWGGDSETASPGCQK